MTDFMRQLQTFSQEFGVTIIVSILEQGQYMESTYRVIQGG